jgi:hypothetical protein
MDKIPNTPNPIEDLKKLIEKIRPTTKKVYISGPITGLPNLNKDAFYETDRILTQIGYQPINPFDLIPESDQTTKSWEYFMKVDIKYLMDAGLVIMLPGWMNSDGALCEFFTAKLLKIPVISSYNDIITVQNSDLPVMNALFSKLLSKIVKNDIENMNEMLKTT